MAYAQKEALFALTDKLPEFPKTRYQGSKRKMLRELQQALFPLDFETCLDLYSGSASVSLLLRYMGKTVNANDYLSFANVAASVLLSATKEKIIETNYQEVLNPLLNDTPTRNQRLVANNFGGIYFLDEENIQIDNFCQNITTLDDFSKSLFIYAVGQALLMKRPYNLFHRANLQVRTKDVVRSFGNKATWDTPIYTHAVKAIGELLRFPFPQEKSHAVHHCNTLDIDTLQTFAAALQERGMLLARGDRRGFVALDMAGGIYSLTRWISGG